MASLRIERLGRITRVALGPTNLGLIEARPDAGSAGDAGGLRASGSAGDAGVVHGSRGADSAGAAGAADASIVLVDSGNDEDAGRKILRVCEAEGLGVGMIVNTHSNADHCGGNAFIQARTGCRIAATRIEAAFIETPELEPSYLWGGFPPPALRNKFLMARASRVTDILEPPCIVPGIAGDSRLRAIPLPGHFFGMVGIMTEDGVFFAADAVASVEILRKYHVFYLYDVAAHLSTLDMLAGLEAEWFVPSHAEPTRDLGPTVKANRDKCLEIAEFIRDSCAEPETSENLLARLADHYSITLNSAQHSLIGSTLRSYLAWLVARKEIVPTIERNRMLFAVA